jgi:hypothetical protein
LIFPFFIHRKGDFMQKPQLEEDAQWREYYKKKSIIWTEQAPQNPERGIALSNKDGEDKLYRWDTSNGDLDPLISDEYNLFTGSLSPNGEYIYFILDKKGNEQGHYVRVPYEGGDIEDLTPSVGEYSSFNFLTHSSGAIAFDFADSEGYGIYLQKSPCDKVVEIYRSNSPCYHPIFSANGDKIAILQVSESEDKKLSTLIIDIKTSEIITTLTSKNGDHCAAIFSPLKDDTRVVIVSTESGFYRPKLWNDTSKEYIEPVPKS